MGLPVYKCSSYCVAMGYDLVRVINILNDRLPFMDSRSFKEAVLCFDANEEGEKCVVAFSYGVIVFWGFVGEEENEIIESLRPAVSRSLEFVEFEANPISLVSEDFNSIRVCDITINRYGYSHKLAFSFAVAQSIKVHFYEMTVESSAGDMHFLSESLSLTGVVSLSKRQMSQKIGEVFLKKNMINLNPEVLDMPEVIWEDDELEAIYNNAVSYFDINKRMSVLNKRLDTMSDLLMLLSEELKYRSGERTDKIITALIFIEVLIAIIEFTFFKFK